MKVFKDTYNKIYPMLTTDVAIDFGTASTLVYLKGKGVVVNEPSVVAVNDVTSHVIAVGRGALEMVGRTPRHIRAIKPLSGGVISDTTGANSLLEKLLSHAKTMTDAHYIAPRVIVGIPSETTNTERQNVRDATKIAGARSVYLVDEPVAAAVGAKLPIHDPLGSLIIDIGGGSTDIALLSLGGVVLSRTVRVAGEDMTRAIKEQVRTQFTLVIGDSTAEELKRSIKNIEDPSARETLVTGRDVLTGLPQEVMVREEDLVAALVPILEELEGSIRLVLEESPPELVKDIAVTGAFLVGGGALLKGLDEWLERRLGISIHIPPEPLTAVVRGAGAILEDFDVYQSLLIPEEGKWKR